MDWDLYALLCHLEGARMEGDMLNMTLSWGPDIVPPIGAAIVPLVVHPDEHGTANRFQLRGRDGRGVAQPETPDLDAKWMAFEGKPPLRAEVQFPWPGDAAFAQVLLLSRIAVPHETNTIASRFIAMLVRGFSRKPSATEVQAALAWRLRNHPPTRDQCVLRKP